MVPRIALICGVLVASGLFIADHLQGFDRAALWLALGGLSIWQVLVSLAAVAVAFVAVAGQERAIVAHLALPVARGGRAAAAAAAVSQTVGFGPVVGAIVRRRLVPDLTLGQSFAISAGITLGFFAGLGVLVLASVALVPGTAHQIAAMGALMVIAAVLAVVALSPGVTVFGLRKPNLFVMGRFLGWLALDLVALALALWVVLPSGTVGFWQFLPVFLMALGVGVASGSPGGVGPFEATLLACLPLADAAGLVAGIIAYRALAYALPALCGALWAMVGKAGGSSLARLTEHRHPPMDFMRALPSAETQLVRQGALTLMAGADGWHWVSGQLPHTRVMLGSVLGPVLGPVPGPGPEVQVPRAAALQAVERLARSEARMLCLYKIDARLAVLARARGHVVVPIAREAVLNPVTFTQSGPDRARLRRKLAHARKAGVVVAPVTTLPEVEMAAVVADWALVHGRERGFSMGRWDAAYVAGQRVIAARSAAGVLLAFITFHEGAGHEGAGHAGAGDWVLDLVRFRPGTPDGTTYAMVCCALDLARVEGIGRLSLAAVPEPAFGLTGPLAALVRRATHGSIGLAQFKSAFAPKWEPRYAAAPSRMALLLAGLEVTRAIMRPGRLHPRRARLVVHQGGGGAKGGDLPAERAA